MPGGWGVGCGDVLTLNIRELKYTNNSTTFTKRQIILIN